MSRSANAVPVVLLAFALAGGTTAFAAATSTSPTHQSSGMVVADDRGSVGADLGNDRPAVTNDGLMVRRRVALAVYPAAGANLVSLRKELDTAATRLHTSLSIVPPAVLDPALLEPVAPEMTLVLPSGTALADARNLIDPASSGARRFPDVARYSLVLVLVHDLRFTVGSARPADLAAAIAREGILSDALDNYTTTVGRNKLDITYTGPLLSDDLVESVRAGIARRARVQPAGVTISPGSTTGVGVDMAKEPAVAPVVTVASPAHNHGAGLPAVKAAAQSSYSSYWSVAMLALAALLILTLALLMRRRTNRRGGRSAAPRHLAAPPTAAS